MNAAIEQTAEPTEVEQVNQVLANYDRVAAGIGNLAQLYKGIVYEVTTTEGLTAAKAARAAIREPRYEVEKIRKSAKAPLLALGRRVDAEAHRITSQLLELEEPIQAQIAAEEARRERVRQEKIAAEQRRVQEIQGRIAEITDRVAMAAAGLGSLAIADHINHVLGVECTESVFQEFLSQAQQAKAATLERLYVLEGAARSRENEAARLEREREELERQRREHEERDRLERERIAAERRELEERRAAQAAEEQRLAQQREELERKEATLSAPAPQPAPTQEPEHVVIAGPIAPAVPTLDEMLEVLAAHYDTDTATVTRWLAAYDWEI